MIVRYEIDYWDDIAQKPKSECGIVGVSDSDTIGTAVDRACNYYGKENVVSIKVYECEDVLVDEELREMLADK